MLKINLINKWKPYRYNYEKVWYDIELHDGSIIGPCWPNAGWFHNEHFGMIREEEVRRFRISDKHPLDYLKALEVLPE